MTVLKAVLKVSKNESRSPSIISSLCESVESAISQWTSVQASVKKQSRIDDIVDINKTIKRSFEHMRLVRLAVPR